MPFSAISNPDRSGPKRGSKRPLVITTPPSLVAPPQALIRRGSHAGLPQRQPTKKSRHLTFEQVANLANAAAFAHHQGNRLTVAVTILWSHVAGFDEDHLAPMTTRLLDRLNRWMRQHAKVNLHAIWTRERGSQKGHHINIMANIPVRLLPQLEQYLVKSFGMTNRGVNFSYGRFGMQTKPMQMGKLRYICKTLDPTAFVYRGFEIIKIAETLGIWHGGADGEVRAKRAGTTQNLNRKARRAAGWEEIRFPEDVANLLNPTPFVQQGSRIAQRPDAR